MHERKEATGNGIVVVRGKKITAVVAVEKWESRGVSGIPKRSGKPASGFPRSGFSTASFWAIDSKMRGLCRLVILI